MDLWKSLSGMLEVELNSAEPENLLKSLSTQGIEIRNIQYISELACCMLIRRRDYKTVKELCAKRGSTVSLRRKMGIFWPVKEAMNRPVLMVCSILLFCGAMMLPSRIFYVMVEGNYTIPTQKIVDEAKKCGICFGASRREVRSEKVKNALLSAVPELQWAGVNTAGCVAVISVREKSIVDSEEKEKGITSIVAERDGYILSATADAGVLMIQPGDAVEKGQVLISGYEECGIFLRATRSRGEIIAQTSRYFDAVAPCSFLNRGAMLEIKKNYTVVFGKKRINLWKDSGILEGSCGRMYEEYYITLPGGFQIPIALCIDRYYVYEECPAQLELVWAEEALPCFADSYLLQQMIAGEIRERDYTVTHDGEIFRLKGNYVCVEMIGRERQEKIGDIHGKNS